MSGGLRIAVPSDSVAVFAKDSDLSVRVGVFSLLVLVDKVIKRLEQTHRHRRNELDFAVFGRSRFGELFRVDKPEGGLDGVPRIAFGEKRIKLKLLLFADPLP